MQIRPQRSNKRAEQLDLFSANAKPSDLICTEIAGLLSGLAASGSLPSAALETLQLELGRTARRVLCEDRFATDDVIELAAFVPKRRYALLNRRP